jgi:DNA-binding GntR family transcriptional regulator
VEPDLNDAQEESQLVAIPLRDQVHRRLRNEILAGQLPVGERISPPEIARRLGVSTTPVRDALRSLEEEGLVETSPRRWTRVAAPNARLAREMYPIIAALEEFAVQTIPSVDQALLARLDEANEDFRAAATAGDMAACLKANDVFHGALLRASGNQALERIVSDLKARMRLLDSQFFRIDTERSAAEHAAIIKALGEGDLQRGGAIVREQWLRDIPMLGAADDGAAGDDDAAASELPED